MSASAGKHYDVAIVGAGPVGSVCALAHARKGADTILLEANPQSATRLAGEWLHPPAVSILEDLGVTHASLPCSTPGLGFVIFPENSSEPIELPYPDGLRGLACDHELLVNSLRGAIGQVDNIDFRTRARVMAINDNRVVFTEGGNEQTITASRIIGADGRSSVVRKSLGLTLNPMLCSRMFGVMLHDVDIPFEGYGHVVLGGPGPMLIYDLGGGRIRITADVPLDLWKSKDRLVSLAETCSALLPDPLGPAFIEGVRAGRIHSGINQLRPRATYGTPDMILIGDAVGHYHPMTAVGMTLGFGDALDLAESTDFDEFKAERFKAVRIPEFLAMGLYEIFADSRSEAVALRNAVYAGWRGRSSYREKTMRILACEDRSVTGLVLAFSGTVARAAVQQVPQSLRGLATGRPRALFRSLTIRLWWFQRAVRQLRQAIRNNREETPETRTELARALLHSIPSERPPATAPLKDPAEPDAGPTLSSAIDELLDLQNGDGSWEGEMVWCPMLTAQYALVHIILDLPLGADRRRRILRSFEQTRLPSGLWGMHIHAHPQLFMTTLVYTAARLLGMDREDPMLGPARTFIQNEGVLAIPSWGKFWLAVLNLYDWKGVNTLLPELWFLPKSLVLHPSNWYCHTRLIYMAMSSIYAGRFQMPLTADILALRDELYPGGYERAAFARSRGRLRDGDLFARPTLALRIGYQLARLYDRVHGKALRDRCVQDMLERIRWELRTTNHTSISPVSGLLNILSLWLQDPDDEDCHAALGKLEGWLWEDEEDGLRVTGARSGSWDTGFALQALATAPATDRVHEASRKGAAFLLREQIRESFPGYREAFRADPKGGWCFAGGWHGWPVSDCTAEAVLGLVAAQGSDTDPGVLADAAKFLLQSQNRDGGFGSYESKRTVMGLEWMNPAEMFGESMTENSFVECTASCLAALDVLQHRFPDVGDAGSMTDAIARGSTWLRRVQEEDGSWRGVWGVQYVYGTLFGIRGLIATGANRGDPAIIAACRWLVAQQREDGGWGEHLSGCHTGTYAPHPEGQYIQTAWALIALLEAGSPDWTAITRGTAFLVDAQDADGSWPEQDMAGVFFRTALLDYKLYRRYFPVHALGLYEQRRRNRGTLTPPAPAAAEPERMVA